MIRLRDAALGQRAEALGVRSWPQEGPGRVGQGGFFEAPPGDLEVHLGGGQVGVTQQSLHFGEGGAGVDEER
jgi:hypothetical protein